MLVIEDDPGVLTTIRAIIARKRPDWQTEYVNESEEAEQRLEAIHYDAVLSDLHMPQLDAPTLIEKMKAHGPLPALVFLTGYNDHSMTDVLERGAAAVLAKPFDIDRFLETLEVAIAIAGDSPADSES